MLLGLITVIYHHSNKDRNINEQYYRPLDYSLDYLFIYLLFP